MTQQQWGPPQTPWGRPPQPVGWGRPGGQPGRGQLSAAPQAGYPQAGSGQPPFGPQFAPPRRRRRNPLRSLLAAMIILGLITMAGKTFTDMGTAQGAEQYESEQTQAPPPDTEPPPLPAPETYAEAEQLLIDNDFYDQTAPIPVRCDAQPINVGTADDEQLEAHFETLMECLVRVWQPPVEAAGFQVVQPTVTIFGSNVTTRCGDAEVNAFYCSGDQQVYFSNRLADFVPIVKREKWAADVVMAHEFGHALQARTAILISSHALGEESGSEQTELELSRRLEVQADCLAGMFMRATSESMGIQQSDVQGIQATFNAVGDDVVQGKPNVVGNHGLGRSRSFWGSTGLGTSKVNECNTYTAKDSLVR